MTRIGEAFGRLKSQGRKAFIPYIMSGDPDLRRTREHLGVLIEGGADIVELGVPFSDPLADGPTIQRAAERAREAGVTLRTILPFVRELRRDWDIPIVLMTYYNPVFRYGEERFLIDAAQAGVDGLIVPDLPPEEGESLRLLAARAGIDTIFLVAPTSGKDRIQAVVTASSGFVYYVSMTGITGSRISVDSALMNHLKAVRERTDKPVAVGFGVSTPEDAAVIGSLADGVIVGSAIVKKFYEHPKGARDFIVSLRRAIDGGPGAGA